jgi:quercetin dioxygenase-like cupin family protein
MSFVNEFDPDRVDGVVAGPSDGTRELLVVRQRVGARECGWVHRHDAEQIMRVLSGSLVVAVGDEERRCERGAVAVIPPGTWHGFAGGDEAALLEVIGGQGMRTYLAVRDTDGTLAAIEVNRCGVQWDAAPPPGSAYTTDDESRRWSATRSPRRSQARRESRAATISWSCGGRRRPA